jgi:2-hydroxychromene-2-carboxylate isomerase
MMAESTGDGNEVKMYSDFKSPYAYLAFDPAMALPQRFNVSVRWIPFQLRLKGKGERSTYSEYKVKYSYFDARRFAKERGLWIRGPLKVFDTTPAAIGGPVCGETRPLARLRPCGVQAVFPAGIRG